MNKTPTDERIIRARTGLVMSQPFFASIALRLKLVSDSSGTVWTDGVHLGYDPKFLDTITQEQIKGVIAHEAMHVAQGHAWRRGARDPELWNEACDYSINQHILNARLELPPDAKINAKYGELGAESVYDILLQQKTPPPPKSKPQKGQGQDKGQPSPGQGQPDPGDGQGDEQGDGQGDGDKQGQGQPGTQPAPSAPPKPWGEVRDAPSPDEGGITEAENEIRVMEAYQSAKAMGKVPGGMGRLIERITTTPVDWRAVLHEFMQRTAKNDYSWHRPNKRYLALGLYLPSLSSEQMPPVVICVDTSGSVSAKELAEFGNEINAVIDHCRPESVQIVYCDSRINKTVEFLPDEPVVLEAVGGGGTDFRPPFSWVDEQGLQPACLLYLTDLYGPAPQHPPDYPVLWVATTKEPVPWGEVVRLRNQ